MTSFAELGIPQRHEPAQPIQLTDTDWRSLYDRAEKRGEQLYQPIMGGTRMRLPQCLGDSSDRLITLRGGLSVAIRQGKLKRTIRYRSVHEAHFPLVAKFYLAGRSRVQTLDAVDVPSDYEETNDCHYLYHLPNVTEVEEWPGDESLHVVYVSVDPSYFSTFDLSQTPLSAALQTLLQGDTSQRFHQPLGHMTSAMRQVLQQIAHCPYRGMMQQLYLESKALELLTLQFASWVEARPQHREVTLRSPDIDQLHQAREILIQQAAQPPSLAELARQVGSF